MGYNDLGWSRNLPHLVSPSPPVRCHFLKLYNTRSRSTLKTNRIFFRCSVLFLRVYPSTLLLNFSLVYHPGYCFRPTIGHLRLRQLVPIPRTIHSRIFFLFTGSVVWGNCWASRRLIIHYKNTDKFSTLSFINFTPACDGIFY